MTDVASGSDGVPRVAAATAVVTWGLAVLALVLAVAARQPPDESTWFFAVDVAVAVVYGTVSALILSRRRHPVGVILALTAVGGGLAALGFSYPALARTLPGLPGADQVAALQSTAWVPGTLALFLVVPWLVRDHPLGGARYAVALGTALIGVFLLAQAAGWEAAFTPLLVTVIVVGLVAAGDVERRRRHGPEAERNGLGWLALGAALLALSFVPLAVPWGLLRLPIWLTPALHLASQAVYPAAILVAVLRGRMWGLRLAVSRTVLAGVMTVSLALLYVVVTVAATRVVPGAGAAQVVGAAAVAAAVQPSRLWLERRVHRLVYGAASAPDHVVRRLGSHLRLDGTVDDLLLELARDLGRSMRLESVSVVVPGRDAVTWGAPAGHPVVTPLHHRAVHVGDLVVTLPGGESLGARGERTLVDLAPVVATAVAVARAAREVEEARAGLARARLEERRTIRREIHDGLGPALAGMRLGLHGARNLLGTDPAAAAELLTALEAELDRRVADVRTLSHSLLPPVLDELGLGPALQELAARHADAGLEVDLHLGHDDDLDPAVAAAAYGIVSEALVNVARHAGTDACAVATDSSPGELRITVTDRGRGIAPGARAGVGSQAMRERAEEQGGELTVRSRADSGTVVEAHLPTRVSSRA